MCKNQLFIGKLFDTNLCKKGKNESSLITGGIRPFNTDVMAIFAIGTNIVLDIYIYILLTILKT